MPNPPEQNDYEIIDLKPQTKYSDNPKNVFEMSPYHFNKYFMDNVYPDLIKVAQGNIQDYSDLSKIKKTEKTRKKWGTIFLILFCISCVFPLLIFILFPIAAYLVYLERKRKTPFARDIRNMVFSHFNINILPGLNLFCFNIPNSEAFRKILLTSPLHINIDDALAFTYKDLPITIAEVSTPERKDNIWLHVLVGAKINKKFTRETIVCSKYINPISVLANAHISYLQSLPSILTDKHQKVLLEDNVFNDKFVVFSEDQIEARYLLTPSFMSRLLKYKTSHKSKWLSVVFNNDISPVSNVFLDIGINKDFFEVNDDPLSAKTYWNILQEIKEILEIIDALKLDQDIGL